MKQHQNRDNFPFVPPIQKRLGSTETSQQVTRMAQTTLPFLKSTHLANGASAFTVSLNATAVNNVILVAKFDYQSKEAHELDLKKNERLILIDNSKNWWLVRKCDSDQTGYVPSNYVKKEKKSLLEKIMPRKLQQINNTIDLKTTASTSNSASPHNQISTTQHLSPKFHVNSTTITTTTLSSPNSTYNSKTDANISSNLLTKAVVKHKYTANK